MKRLFLLTLAFLLSLSLVSCSSNQASGDLGEKKGDNQVNEVVTLKVGATAVPHAEVLEEVKPLLKEQGIELEIVVYQDYVQPNIQLSEGDIDANYFQHIPYFDSFTNDRSIKNLVNIAKVHIEPMGIYSNEIDDLSKLEDGSKVSIPNDPSNMGRALALLETAGLIKLEDGVGVKATDQDVVDNPKNLDIVPLDAANLPRSLQDVSISVINTNFALQANLNPVKDALLIEGADSPYANVLTIRAEDKDKESINKLAEALLSTQIKTYIENKYQGAVLPAQEWVK